MVWSALTKDKLVRSCELAGFGTGSTAKTGLLRVGSSAEGGWPGAAALAPNHNNMFGSGPYIFVDVKIQKQMQQKKIRKRATKSRIAIRSVANTAAEHQH